VNGIKGLKCICVAIEYGRVYPLAWSTSEIVKL